MSEDLLIGVLGNQKSGKTETWNALFGRTVHIGKRLRPLWLTDTEYVDVFLVSGSSEERNKYVGDLITVKHPRIVLCSFQYREGVSESFSYFSEREYFLFVQWLNPGYSDRAAGSDLLGLIPLLLAEESLLSMRNGKCDVESRVREIREFISGWAGPRGLIQTAGQTQLV
jgi:hypothetical protein